MNKIITQNKPARFSPYIFLAFWSLLLLANFVPTIPQPSTIIGYLWKVEFAFAAFLLVSIVFIIKMPKTKAVEFSRKEIYSIILPVALFTIWSGLSGFWAESWRNALHHTLLWACYAVFYLLVRQIVARPKLLDISLRVTGVVITMLGIACIIEYFNTNFESGAFFTYRYYKYAEVSVMLLPIFLAVTLQLKKRAAFLSGLTAIFAWLIILLSYSRTELIAGFVCIGLFFALIVIFGNLKNHHQTLILLFFALLIPALLTQTSILKSDQNSTVSRLSGGEDNQKNLQWRFLVWGVSLEAFKLKPLQGIGADNFVIDYRDALESYAVSNQQNKLLEVNQDVIAERSHNEYLQILAELGIVGIALIGWLLAGIGTLLFSPRRKQVSLLSLASMAGMFAFLVSSLASSYSFRVPANGVCFFFLLALAAHGFLQKEKSNAENRNAVYFQPLSPAFIGCSLLICIALLIFSAVRGTSLMYLETALESSEPAEAEANYQKALALDGREPLFNYYYGLHLYGEKRTVEAVPRIRFAINHGIATSVNYFNLAAAQMLSNQHVEAEKTLTESLRVYPNSVFLRTAYAAFLEKNGRLGEAEAENEKAQHINLRQALSWRTAHVEGIKNLTKAGMSDKQLLPTMELKPNEAIYTLLDFQRQANPAVARREF